ncbi:MAG: hypothetical protein N2746_00900 [Deltaproteobacteria bacterium]|nr:hypothetical protein [Deltaproteobacteria bacterium]
MNIAIINHFEEESDGFYSIIVQRARRENLKDIVNRITGFNLFDKIILQTNALGVLSNRDDLEILNTSGIKNFGERLKLVLKKYPNSKIFYTGSGSSVFLDRRSLARFLEYLNKDSIIANNLFSADYFLFSTDNPDLDIENVSTDNALPRFLIEKYGLEGIEIRRNEFSLFDIDGPLDLLSLKLSKKGGMNLKKFLSGVEIENPNLARAIESFTKNDREVLLWGRISEFLIQFLRYRTACRTKFVVEGRGLVSQGVKEFYSIFFDSFYRLGEDFLFENISRYCSALFVDSRVLFAHLKIDVSKEERFSLDMLNYENICHRRVKGLCEMALNSKIPVIFCNHSFLNSGIPLLIDMEWRRKGFKGSKYGNGIVKKII